MVAIEDIKKQFESGKILFILVCLTFLLIPTGTAPPLITIGLAFIVWLFFARQNSFSLVVKKEWFLPVVVFVCLPWIGLLYSKDLTLGLDYALKTKYWLALFVTAGVVYNEKRVERIVIFFWLGLSAGAFLAILQYIGVMKTFHGVHLGFGIVHTLISIYLVIGILTASYCFKKARSKRGKIITFLLILLFTLHLTILKGRGGYVVFLLLSPLIINNLMSTFKYHIRIIFIVLLMASIFLSPSVQERLTRTLGQLQQKETILKGTWDERFTRPFMIHSTVKLIAEHPFIGIGTGSLKYYTEKLGHSISHPHNNILYMTVSFGMIGTIVYLWLFFKMFIISWKNRDSLLGYFVFSCCIVIFLGGMFDTLILNSGTALLLPMGYGMLNHLDLANHKKKFKTRGFHRL